MFKAVGFLISLWAVSLYFGNSIQALDRAATETFNAVQVAALVSQAQISKTQE